MKKMSRYKVLLFLVMFLLAAFSDAAPQDTLTVVSYNIFNAQNAETRGESTLQEIAGFIKKIQPDFISLQEVDSATHRLAKLNDDHYFSLADSLAELSGMHANFGKAIDFDGGSYGIAILSQQRLGIRKTRLPNPKEGEARVLLSAEARTNSGTAFTFAATHLDDRHSKNRMAQIDTISTILTDEKKPVILAGDLNFEPNSEEYRKAQKHWMDVALEINSDPDFTFPTEDPVKRIDYILLSDQHQWKVVEYHTPRVAYSDHLPIVATVVLQ